MKPQIDRDLCIGCGLCESLCPAVFKLDDGKSTVLEGVNYKANKACVEKAIENCPVQAIKWEEK
ncbi:ferredoxin [Patescibacteria group bacterium]|nr:ferredoxin [Patescibacteria group bacterium]